MYSNWVLCHFIWQHFAQFQLYEKKWWNWIQPAAVGGKFGLVSGTYPAMHIGHRNRRCSGYSEVMSKWHFFCRLYFCAMWNSFLETRTNRKSIAAGRIRWKSSEIWPFMLASYFRSVMFVFLSMYILSGAISKWASNFRMILPAAYLEPLDALTTS